MNVWQRFQRWLFDTDNDLEGFSLEQEMNDREKTAENVLNLKLLSMATALGYLAVGLASCDFRTIQNGKEVFGEEYFRLNCQMNPNQTKHDFCMKLLYKLGWNNEALIFSPPFSNDLYIADSYTRRDGGLLGDSFEDITVDGDNNRFSFHCSEVMLIRLNWTGLRPLLGQVASEYEALITTAATGYKRQAGERGTLQMVSGASGTNEQYERIVERLRKQFDSYYRATNAVLPIPKGYTYTQNATAHRNTSEMNDLINLSDEWNERLGLALRFPVALLKGNVENIENARNDLIAYGIRQSLAEPIMEAYNSRRIGMKGFTKGSYLLIDTTPLYISHPDHLGSFCDKMISTAQYSPEDLRRLRKEPVIGTPEAREYYITMNYSTLKAAAGQQDNGTPEESPEEHNSET